MGSPGGLIMGPKHHLFLAKMWDRLGVYSMQVGHEPKHVLKSVVQGAQNRPKYGPKDVQKGAFGGAQRKAKFGH